MQDRDLIANELNATEQALKDLVILYEQYFAGVEKREPVKARERLAIRLRRFANRRIMQTDLNFKYQTLATRFHSYAGYWDRVLRLIDEGRYSRHQNPLPKPAPLPAAQEDHPRANEEIDAVYRQVLEARRNGKIEGSVPDRQQVADFLEKQKEKIRERFGDRPVEFRVETLDGKLKIKVRTKN